MRWTVRVLGRLRADSDIMRTRIFWASQSFYYRNKGFPIRVERKSYPVGRTNMRVRPYLEKKISLEIL